MESGPGEFISDGRWKMEQTPQAVGCRLAPRAARRIEIGRSKSWQVGVKCSQNGHIIHMPHAQSASSTSLFVQNTDIAQRYRYCWRTENTKERNCEFILAAFTNFRIKIHGSYC